MHFKGGVGREAIRVERLDHLGLIGSVINDLGLVNMIDARLKPDDEEAITPGEAIKGMILNGLGFANRSLSLTPQFFAGKPLDLLFRPGVEASMFNRFKLGRPLDEVNKASPATCPMAVTYSLARWPSRCVSKKPLISALTISTRRVSRSRATTSRRVTSRPSRSPMATPKTTGRT